MYKNEDDFVRGQKIKLLLIIIIMVAVVAHSYLNTGSLTDPWWR
jgi:hypothetical protein